MRRVSPPRIVLADAGYGANSDFRARCQCSEPCFLCRRHPIDAQRVAARSGAFASQSRGVAAADALAMCSATSRSQNPSRDVHAVSRRPDDLQPDCVYDTVKLDGSSYIPQMPGELRARVAQLVFFGNVVPVPRSTSFHEFDCPAGCANFLIWFRSRRMFPISLGCPTGHLSRWPWGKTGLQFV